MQAKQLPKPKTGIADLDRHLAQMADVLNPVLRNVATPGNYVSVVMDNLRGVASGTATGDLVSTQRTFTANGGTLLVFFSGSAFAGSAGVHEILLKLDGSPIVTAQQYFNETSSYKTLVGFRPVTGISAGQHTLMASLGADLTGDANSIFNAIVLEIPT